MERLTQEEIEHRRYLKKRIQRRKRRRQVMIARAVVLLIIVLIFTGIIFAGSCIYKSISNKNNKVNVEKKQTVTILPDETEEPADVNIPDGYDKYYKELVKLKKKFPEVNDIILNLSQYPEDLLNLAITNQETLSFVANYPKHKNDSSPGGKIRKDELLDGIPLFQQWDERWGYVTYGSNIIAIDGCGPTCMSMVYTGITGKTSKSPADIAEFCIEKNFYDSENGTSWSFMSTGAQKLGLQSEKISVDKKTIINRLKNGHPVICSMAPGDFTTQGHFIVLTGVKNNKLIINDPNSIERSEKRWDIDQVLGQVKAAWAYSAG